MPPKKAKTDDTLTTETPKNMAQETTVMEQDLYIPLSENLIIGFFFDMIHDFPESSIMTDNSQTDIDYLIMVFDSVFNGYWPDCAYTLRQIVSYFNNQQSAGVVNETETKTETQVGGAPNTKTGQKRSNINPEVKLPRSSRKTKEAANQKMKQTIEGETKPVKFISSKTLIEKAHGFFYTLITRQGLNNGVLTFNFNYDKKSGAQRGDPVSMANKSVITDINKIAGGGRGLPSNYFFGGFLDHQVRLQSLLKADITSGFVYKKYGDARKGANIQSFTNAAIKAINMGSAPDYTDALGSWEKYSVSELENQDNSSPMEQTGGTDDALSETSSMRDLSHLTEKSKTEIESTDMSILTNKSANHQPTAKPMFVVEDALKSSTQLLSTFALNNRFVFSVGENNQFNLVPIKSTAERYDAAAKKLQTPPELYDKGQKSREEVLERIATRQASCYDYFYRKFNLRFGSFDALPQNRTPNFDYGMPIASENQKSNWKEYINLSIGPNKFFFKDTANLTFKMALGSNILAKMTDDDIMDYGKRKEWATSFIKNIINTTENAETIFVNSTVMEANDKDTKQMLNATRDELTKKLSDKKTTYLETLNQPLPLDYLYNFAYSKEYTKSSGKPFIPLDNDTIFPSYYQQRFPINNIRKEREIIAEQLKGTVNDWLERRLKRYMVTKDQLMDEYQKVIGQKIMPKIASSSKVKIAKLYHEGTKMTEMKASWSMFVAFLLVRQFKSPVSKQDSFAYANLLWKDVLEYDTNNEKSNQLSISLSIMMTIMFNIRLAEYCIKKVANENVKLQPEHDNDDTFGLSSYIWVPSIDLYLTDIVMSGCSNGSKIVVSPSGAENEDNVTVPVSGDSEETVKQGASVASVLHKWRIGIIADVFESEIQTNEKSEKTQSSNTKKRKRDVSISGGARGKLTSEEQKCFSDDIKTEREKLECLSSAAGESRKSQMHPDLADWLQEQVRKANKLPPSQRGPGFTQRDLRKSFGELFQKTAGDFFQVKLAQFLNDTASCFTCDNDACPKLGDQLYDRSLYRPYAENPNGPINQSGILVAADAFYKNFYRPLIASPVQLNTFDVMAGLIGLQQSANVVLQTITRTTLSPGTALYGISNLGAPVREYIESRIDKITNDDEDDEQIQDEPSVKSDSISVNNIDDDDDDDANAKEVELNKIPMIEVDVDLLSVIRRVPSVITNISKLTGFLFINNLFGNELVSVLDTTYEDFNQSFNDKQSFIWKSMLRLVFDFLCYYQNIRPEEALARAKAVTFILSEAYQQNENKTPNDNQPALIKEVVDAFPKAILSSRSVNKLSQDVLLGLKPVSPQITTAMKKTVIAPVLSKEFANAIEIINTNIGANNEPYVSRAFQEVLILLQKATFDKMISQADEKAEQVDDRYAKYTSGWLDLFKKLNKQNRELDAIEGLLALSSQKIEPALPEFADETEELEYASGLLESLGSPLNEEQNIISQPPRKRAKKTRGGKKKCASVPKHRTIKKSRKNQKENQQEKSTNNKTLTQILRELTK